MQVSFTGFKNAGLCHGTEVQNENGCFTEKTDLHFLNIQLTDDYNGKDLTTYQQILKKPNMSEYKNNRNKDFINICTHQNISPDNKRNNTVIFLNDKILPINDQNLPIISFIAKLIRRIKETPENKYIVDNDYKAGDEVAKLIIPGVDLYKNFEDSENQDEYYRLTIDNIHAPNHVKAGSSVMFDQIQETMLDYFS